MTVIALGMGLGYVLWGKSMLAPLTFAATRRSNFMSIFYFLRGTHSPIWWVPECRDIDQLAPFVLFLALLRAWSWYRAKYPDIESACAVAVTTTAVFYHTGFPQYHMVPFVVGTYWVVHHWEVQRNRAVGVIAAASYFAWLAAFDTYYLIVENRDAVLHWNVLREYVALPSFLFGCGFIAAVVLSSNATDRDVSA